MVSFYRVFQIRPLVLSFLSSKKEEAVAISCDGVRIFLIDCFKLGLGLQNNRSRYFTASYGGNQLFKLWYLPDICKFIKVGSEHEQAAFRRTHHLLYHRED